MQPDFEVGKPMECSKAKDAFDCKIKSKMNAGCHVVAHDEWLLTQGARASCMKIHFSECWALDELALDKHQNFIQSWTHQARSLRISISTLAALPSLPLLSSTAELYRAYQQVPGRVVGL